MKKFKYTFAMLAALTSVSAVAQEKTDSLDDRVRNAINPTRRDARVSPEIPSIGGFAATTVSGSLGTYNGGLTAGVGLSLETFNGGIIDIDAKTGQPILWLQGRTKMIPINIFSAKTNHVDQQYKIKGDITFDLTAHVLTADGQLQIPTNGDTAKNHLMITPEAAAKFGYTVSSTEGTLNIPLSATVHVGPSVGAAEDGDGKSWAAGAMIGLDFEAKFPFNATDNGLLSWEIKQYTNAIGNLAGRNGSHIVLLGAERDFGNHSKVFLGLEAKGNTFDVQPVSGANSDNGQAGYAGLKATLKY